MTQTMEGKWCLDGSWCSDAGCNGAHFPNSTCSGKSRGSKSPFLTMFMEWCGSCGTCGDGYKVIAGCI